MVDDDFCPVLHNFFHLLLLRRTAESDERYQDNAKKFFHFPLQDESIIYAFVFNTIEALNYSSSGKQRPPSPAGPNTATNPFVSITVLKCIRLALRNYLHR
jgi:hypothetical protein